jgi:putative addiction module component (TIGR02574 family)
MSSIAIAGLSPAERLALIGELWDSLDESSVPVPQALLDELDRRIAAADTAPQTGKTWEELDVNQRRHRR